MYLNKYVRIEEIKQNKQKQPFGYAHFNNTQSQTVLENNCVCSFQTVFMIQQLAHNFLT